MSGIKEKMRSIASASRHLHCFYNSPDVSQLFSMHQPSFLKTQHKLPHFLFLHNFKKKKQLQKCKVQVPQQSQFNSGNNHSYKIINNFEYCCKGTHYVCTAYIIDPFSIRNIFSKSIIVLSTWFCYHTRVWKSFTWTLLYQCTLLSNKSIFMPTVTVMENYQLRKNTHLFSIC